MPRATGLPSGGTVNGAGNAGETGAVTAEVIDAATGVATGAPGGGATAAVTAAGAAARVERVNVTACGHPWAPCRPQPGGVNEC